MKRAALLTSKNKQYNGKNTLSEVDGSYAVTGSGELLGLLKPRVNIQLGQHKLSLYLSLKKNIES
eukprot:8592258-Ditylum_brightwellii.AAC.1